MFDPGLLKSLSEAITNKNINQIVKLFQQLDSRAATDDPDSFKKYLERKSQRNELAGYCGIVLLSIERRNKELI